MTKKLEQDMRQVQQDIYTLEVLEPHYFVTCMQNISMVILFLD